ncbi:hypothetical protein BSKO_09674 [Bryopsis sp. KO-2023]|nr:hypothetical protein BSKO_09674 [Bryopsis sp. KO-2023]
MLTIGTSTFPKRFAPSARRPFDRQGTLSRRSCDKQRVRGIRSHPACVTSTPCTYVAASVVSKKTHARVVACGAADVSRDDFLSASGNLKTALPETLSGDVFGGVTAAVVALPLALAFGVASGMGPQAGLYGAIFAGFFAALLGGTPAQVTGPTGPMTVVTAATVAQYSGNPALVFAMIAMSGLMQIVMGVLKFGRYIRLVPSAVLTGFMSGIGCIILLTQMPALLGLPAFPTTVEALKSMPTLFTNVNPHAAGVGLLSLVICVLTPKKITKYVPSSLLALVVGTVMSTAAGLSLPTLGHIPSQVPSPVPLSFPLEMMPMMLKTSFILALLGGIDSLLTSLVADSLTNTYHDSDQEMIGQGVGNAVAGCFGGIPSAGATMRTVINIRSGGRTRLAGALHSVVLLAVVVGLGGVAQNIPLAVLAGILMKTGLDIIDVKFLERIPRLPFSSTIVMMSVLLLTVFVDLIVAVAAGCILSSLLLVKQLADSQIDGCTVITRQDIKADGSISQKMGLSERAQILLGKGQVGLFAMQGSFTFSASNGMLRKLLPKMEKFRASVIDLSSVSLVDGDAALAIEEMAKRESEAGRCLFVCGASPSITELLDKMGVSEKLSQPPSILTEDALQFALDQLYIDSGTFCKFDQK